MGGWLLPLLMRLGMTAHRRARNQKPLRVQVLGSKTTWMILLALHVSRHGGHRSSPFWGSLCCRILGIRQRCDQASTCPCDEQLLWHPVGDVCLEGACLRLYFLCLESIEDCPLQTHCSLKPQSLQSEGWLKTRKQTFQPQ